ncbi:hypothetical protein A2U01_0089428, partial [Trifolium medium]|nr:hypothetical protein [Trifolium medium]
MNSPTTKPALHESTTVASEAVLVPSSPLKTHGSFLSFNNLTISSSTNSVKEFSIL